VSLKISLGTQAYNLSMHSLSTRSCAKLIKRQQTGLIKQKLGSGV